MRLKKLWLCLLSVCAAWAQAPLPSPTNGAASGAGIVQVASAPSGSCIVGSSPEQVFSTGLIYYCNGSGLGLTGSWTAQSTGTNSPGGATNTFQYNTGSATFGGTSGFTWNPTQGGAVLSLTNPNAANNSTDATGFNATCTYSTDTLTTPGFSDQNCWQQTFNVSMGQGNYGPNPNYQSKKTFFGLLMQPTYSGSGQKFGIGISPVIGHGMSDTAALQMTVYCDGGPITGDENTCGFTPQSYVTEPGNLTIPTVTSSSPARTSCNTYITQSAITRSNTAQAFTVNSTTGCSVNDWVVLGMEPPTRGQSEQAMQITAVGTGTISGIVKNSYQQSVDANVSTGATNATITLSTANSNIMPGQLAIGGSIPAATYVTAVSGTSVTLTQAPTSTATGVTVNFYFLVAPATVITVSSTANFGQDKFLIDTSVTKTGSVSSVSGGAFFNSSTDWAYNMVGGASPVAGCVNLSADTYSGGYAGPGGGGFSTSGQNGPLHDWYAINGLTGNNQLAIVTSSVAGDASYHGNGSIATQATTNTNTTLNITGSLWWQTYNGEYVTASDIPAGTTIASGGGTQTVTLSAAATGSNTNENVTFQGGPYTISPCARVLYWTGSTVVLESNSFAWTQNDQLEMPFVPYPDREGFQLNWSQYTTGGADHDPTGSQGRAFIHLSNEGARTIPNGIYMHNKMQTGGNADKIAYGTGIAIPQTYNGITIGEAQSGQGVTVKATQNTAWASHPGYVFQGGALGSNGTSGLFGDYTTGRLTLETARPQPGTSGSSTSVFSVNNTFSGTAAEFTTNADFAGSTATISGTILRPSTAQDYQICYFLHPTTTGTAGTATAAFTWQDASSNTMTKTGAAVSLSTATAVDSACFPIVDGVLGYIQYSVTVSGATGSPAYDFRYYLMRMAL